MSTSRAEREILSVGTFEPGGAKRCCSLGHLLLLCFGDLREVAGLLLAQHKPGRSREAEGLYPIAPCQEEREDGTSAWKRGAKRGKKPEQSALDAGRAQSAFAPSLLSIPPVLLPDRAR